jgi:hypothetical protein
MPIFLVVKYSNLPFHLWRLDNSLKLLSINLINNGLLHGTSNLLSLQDERSL